MATKSTDEQNRRYRIGNCIDCDTPGHAPARPRCDDCDSKAVISVEPKLKREARRRGYRR